MGIATWYREYLDHQADLDGAAVPSISAAKPPTQRHQADAALAPDDWWDTDPDDPDAQERPVTLLGIHPRPPMPGIHPFPAGVDAVHVWAVARKAAPSIQHDGTVLLVGGRYPARIVLPEPLAASAAEDALRLVGYQVSRTRRSIRGRDLNIEGWSLDGLERRDRHA